ncbi:hypothetical protein Psuf_062900 [Phytohabitans suffuscus]|uniref:Uncharacterized protein n=1 Tax=Phytohabitans suffuscus TaxID=624315 RepID=A0A6F8YS55_9ACTN|nr:hypothetical protein Psuf_062900 [Phytohabitans suffuscus]
MNTGSPAPNRCAGPPAVATANGTAVRAAKNSWYLRWSALIRCVAATPAIYRCAGRTARLYSMAAVTYPAHL